MFFISDELMNFEAPDGNMVFQLKFLELSRESWLRSVTHTFLLYAVACFVPINFDCVYYN